MIIFEALMLCIGLYLATLGFRVVFQKGYVEKLRRHRWRDDNVPPSKLAESYRIDKYVRGIIYLIMGLVLTIVMAVSLLKM
jgi:hypothetical protein